MFDGFVKEITKEIELKESRGRARSNDTKVRFEYAVKFLISELWRNSLSYPPSESSVNLRSGYYSELPRYRDENLTYRQIKAAFEGMINCRMIEVTTAGFFKKEEGSGQLTRFIPTDRLLEKFESLEGHPAFQLKSNTSGDIIILRNKIDGRKQDVDYPDTPRTDRFRSNLTKINNCFVKHWADMRIANTEVAKLAARIMQDENKEPIDLSKRTLTRIFTNGSFEEGGRFYRGWWQNVPSEYRPFITIDSKATSEHDYSQLNPNMIYSLYNHELGSEDAYSRVLGPEHRDVIKQAFNAMFQAKTELKNKPNNINIDKIEMTWKELKEEILKAHKPIKDLFFTGLGNKLQFEDSIIAENVMLQFAKMDAPALPVHDSFIMHHGFGTYGELEEAMRRAFHDRFHRDIGVSKELVVKHKSNIPIDKDGLATPSFEDILNAENDYSQWRNRDDMWMSR